MEERDGHVVEGLLAGVDSDWRSGSQQSVQRVHKHLSAAIKALSPLLSQKPILAKFYVEIDQMTCYKLLLIC